MSELIIRADDLGYSAGVNFAIYRSVDRGIINNVGTMSNMPLAAEGLQLLKQSRICLGLHGNISAGSPVSSPDSVPSLVTGSHFHASKEYREAKEDLVDLVDPDDAKREISAQIGRFTDLTGQLPAYVDVHAILSSNFYVGARAAAKAFNVPYVETDLNNPVKLGNRTLQLVVQSGTPGYDPLSLLRAQAQHPDDGVTPFIVFHPGYLDHYLMTHSSLTTPRTLEAAMLTSLDAKLILAQNHIQLLRLDDVAAGA